MLTIDGRTSMDDIRTANRQAGNHWFEPGTLRFFRSRVGQEVYTGPGGCFFVSSEQGPDGIRRYTVRQARESGAIETDRSGFQAYASLGGAKGRARRAAAGEVIITEQEMAESIAKHGMAPAEAVTA